MKKSQSNFPFIEACLYGFKSNKARLAQKREELERLRHGMSVNAQSYDSPSLMSAGRVGDPVSARVERIDELERDIADLERLVNPIARLVHDFAEDVNDNPTSDYIPMKTMLEKRYFGKSTIDALGMSEGTYRRVRRKLIALAGVYMDVA